MLKNKKAQIMTLDVLFSIVLVILMFFLLFNVVEVRVNRQNTDNINKDFENIGESALLRLINNPEINCYASDTNNNFLVPSCFSQNSIITKKSLGLPEGYKCELSWATNPAITFTNNDCRDVFNPNNVDYYYMVDFNGFYLSQVSTEISKLDYINSYLGTPLVGTEGAFTLRVWK